MPLDHASSADESLLPGVDQHNLAVDSVTVSFENGVAERLRAVFQNAQYLHRIHRLGVFHRIAALVQESGVMHSLASPDDCGNVASAAAFATQVTALHGLHYRSWLEEKRQGKDVQTFAQRHPLLSKAFTLLLVAGNVARASTWQDWRVDREDDLLTERLGLQGSLLDIEAALAQEYTRPGERCLHYIKGPGNGVTVERYDTDAARHIVRDGETAPLHNVVDHVRVGDRLYFDIGPILEQYLRPELLVPCDDPDAERLRLKQYRHARQVVDILTHALQHKLREAWSPRLARSLPNRMEAGGIAAASPDFFDLNDVLLLLQQPDSLFQGVVELGKVMESREFIGDGAKTMTLSVRRWVAGYRSRSLSDADADAVEWRRFREEHLLELYAHRVALEDVIQELSHSSLKQVNAVRVAQLATLYAEYTGIEVPEDERNRDDMLERFDEYRGAVEDDISWLVSLKPSARGTRGARKKKDRKATPAACAIPAGGTSALRNVFTDRFVDAVDHAQRYGSHDYYRSLPSDAIDLNDHAQVAARNFLPSFFTDLPKVLPDCSRGTALLVSSVRSDSHEPGAAWQQDVLQNLQLLCPGGMLIVDGHRESYSRIHRLLPDLPPGYVARWVMHKETGNPLSLIVQREHPHRPTVQVHRELAAKLLDRDSVLAEPSNVMRLRPDLRTTNQVRIQVAALLQSRLEFIGLQQFIDNEVRQRLLRALCRQMIEDLDDADMQSALGTIFEAVRIRITALIARAVEREMVRRQAARKPVTRSELTHEIHGYFGNPGVAAMPDNVDAKAVLDQSFKKLRSWMYDQFGATRKKDRQQQLQVKEHYSEALLHGMIAAVIQHAPEAPQVTEEVLWDMARNIDLRVPPCIENVEDVILDVTKDTVDRIAKMVEVRRRMFA